MRGSWLALVVIVITGLRRHGAHVRRRRLPGQLRCVPHRRAVRPGDRDLRDVRRVRPRCPHVPRRLPGAELLWHITDVPARSYQLRVSLNPSAAFQEVTFDNNTAIVPVTISAP